MDAFQYTLTMKQIDEAKTLKAKEEIARKLSKAIDAQSNWGNIKDTTDIHSFIRDFNCLSRVLPLYTGKGMPKFVKDSCSGAKCALVHRFNDKKNTLTYNMFVNAFKYHDTVNLTNHTPTNFMPTIKLVGDNIPPFKIEYSMYASTRFCYILNDNRSRSSMATLLIELEEVKRKLASPIKYTMIEDCLDKCYAELADNKHETTKEFSEGLQDVITNFQLSADTINARANG